MLGIWARQMLVGLVFGQADEDVLELDDAAGDGSGIELVAVGDQISLLSLGQGVGVQEPAWRSAGSVVEALAPWATVTGFEGPRLGHEPRQSALRILMELRSNGPAMGWEQGRSPTARGWQ